MKGRMGWVARAATLVLPALLAACASISSPTQAVPVVPGGGKGFDPARVFGAAAQQYHLGPGDLLEIQVFQVKDLDRKVRVGATGDISLPLAGTLEVGGLTSEQAQHAIAQRLAATYVQDPQVSVFVKEAASQRVTVDGAVTKPGVFPIVGQINLLQAIALAEGPTPLADYSRVVIFRTIDGKPMAARFDLDRIRDGKMIDPPIYANDIVVVDQSGIKTVLKQITDSLRGFIYFQAYKL